MTAAADPERQLREYVEAQLEAAADSRHGLAMLLQSGVSAEGLDRIKAAHAPLRERCWMRSSACAWLRPNGRPRSCRQRSPRRTRIQAGSNPAAIIEDTFKFVAAGLAGS